jgi:copper(I)-binding protein
VNRALRAATVGVLLLSPVVLSACSAGQVAQTGTQLRDKTGGRAQVGTLALREIALAFPDSGSYSSGDDAELQMAIVNDGSQDDTLTGISGQGFSGAVFTDKSSAAAATATPTSTPASATPLATPTGTPASGTPTATAPASTSAAPSTPTSPPVPTELTIPAGQTVFVGTGTTHITLTGLQSALTTGQYVTLTLSFQKAGDVTVKATVANPTTPLDRSDTYNFDQTGG